MDTCNQSVFVEETLNVKAINLLHILVAIALRVKSALGHKFVELCKMFHSFLCPCLQLSA